MGFEQNYERGLRDRHWGKTLRAFTDSNNFNNPEVIARLAEKSLCAAWRDGKYQYVGQILAAFQQTYHQLADAAQLKLYIAGSSEHEILESFDAYVVPVLEQAWQDSNANGMADIAYVKLCDSCRDGSLLNTSPGEMTSTLWRDFLNGQVRVNLEPALEICINKRGQAVKQAEGRLDDVIQNLSLDRPISEMKQGKKKIIAPRAHITKFVPEMSLLK